MAFEVGQRVRFLHEKQEGIITRLIGNREVEVLIDDFVEMTVPIGDLVPIARAENKNFGNTGQSKAGKTEAKKLNTGPSGLAVRKAATVEYEFIILNPGNDHVLYTFFTKTGSQFTAHQAGMLDPEDQRILCRLSPDEFFHLKSVFVQVIHFPKGQKAVPSETWSGEFRCRQIITQTKPVQIPMLNGEAYWFPFVTSELLPEREEIAPGNHSFKSSRTTDSNVMDLHIEKLVESIEGLSNSDMLDIQLSEFEKEIWNAFSLGKPSMIFIHGIGDGKLKSAIHEKLDELNFISGYRPADTLLYGNGATEVFLE